MPNELKLKNNLTVGGSVSSSGNMTATSFIGNLTGNAATATKLQTARTINGVEFDGTQNITIAGNANALTGIDSKTASYTLVLNDVGKLIESTATSTISITIPNNDTVAIPVGSMIYVAQDNTGAVTIAGASGVTLKIPAGHQAVIAGRHSVVSLVKVATNTWRVIGDLLVS